MVSKRTQAQMTGLVARERGVESELCAAVSHPGVDLLVLVSQALGGAADRRRGRTAGDVRPGPPDGEPDAAVIEIALSAERLHGRRGASVDLVRAVVTARRSAC